MVKIAMIGYGKMGKTIVEVIRKSDHELTAIIDPNCSDCASEITVETLNGAEVVIDFTHPDVIMDNIKTYCELGVNVVVGTTGWYDRMDEVTKMVETAGIGLVWSGNFAVGVNALFSIVEHAAKVFNNLSDYDVAVTEYHHKFKADSPSGTAKMIGNILVENIDRKSKTVEEKLDRAINDDEIHVVSGRVGSMPGTHIIHFDSPGDTIEVSINVRNREGYASGAVLAAAFIADKKGIHTGDELMKDIIHV